MGNAWSLDPRQFASVMATTWETSVRMQSVSVIMDPFNRVSMGWCAHNNACEIRVCIWDIGTHRYGTYLESECMLCLLNSLKRQYKIKRNMPRGFCSRLQRIPVIAMTLESSLEAVWQQDFCSYFYSEFFFTAHVGGKHTTNRDASSGQCIARSFLHSHKWGFLAVTPATARSWFRKHLSVRYNIIQMTIDSMPLSQYFISFLWLAGKGGSIRVTGRGDRTLPSCPTVYPLWGLLWQASHLPWQDTLHKCTSMVVPKRTLVTTVTATATTARIIAALIRIRLDHSYMDAGDLIIDSCNWLIDRCFHCKISLSSKYQGDIFSPELFRFFWVVFFSLIYFSFFLGGGLEVMEPTSMHKK